MRLLILCGILLASTLADVSASFATLGRPPARNLAARFEAYPQALPLVGRFRNLASSAEHPGSGIGGFIRRLRLLYMREGL